MRSGIHTLVGSESEVVGEERGRGEESGRGEERGRGEGDMEDEMRVLFVSEKNINKTKCSLNLNPISQLYTMFNYQKTYKKEIKSCNIYESIFA